MLGGDALLNATRSRRATGVPTIVAMCANSITTNHQQSTMLFSLRYDVDVTWIVFINDG